MLAYIDAAIGGKTLWGGAVAHLSWVIFVSLRMVASARAPLSPIVL